MVTSTNPKSEDELRREKLMQTTLASTALDLSLVEDALRAMRLTMSESAAAVRANGFEVNEAVGMKLAEKFVALLRTPEVEKMTVQDLTGALGSFICTLCHMFASPEGLTILSVVLGSAGNFAQQYSEIRLSINVADAIFNPDNQRRKDN
jgi:hypothetical protein